MRYEDWTYREAEVRLLEPSDLRRVLRLQSVPDYTTLYRFLQRLPPEDVRRVLQAVVNVTALSGSLLAAGFGKRSEINWVIILTGYFDIHALIERQGRHNNLDGIVIDHGKLGCIRATDRDGIGA